MRVHQTFWICLLIGCLAVIASSSVLSWFGVNDIVSIGTAEPVGFAAMLFAAWRFDRRRTRAT